MMHSEGDIETNDSIVVDMDSDTLVGMLPVVADVMKKNEVSLVSMRLDSQGALSAVPQHYDHFHCCEKKTNVE